MKYSNFQVLSQGNELEDNFMCYKISERSEI